ncbi:MAG: sigma-54-dependent Fis family transcriptional regulator [Xanthomonadales bacterium]|nr:sigma-54-dependent Fis family transcriptional regulator [Xanthomonadales bacterium]
MAESAGTGNVLLVDDNTDFQRMMAEVASRHACRLTAAGSLREGRRFASQHEFDLLLVDLGLPDGNGLELIEEVDLAAHGQLAIITGSPSFETAVRAVRAPVAEYLVKPVPVATLARLMEAAHDRAVARNLPSGLRGMIGRSEAMRRVFEQVQKVAPLDACVFLNGESGTGKELVANAIHDLSGRSGRFVAINCGAIAGELLSSQLFGHEKGSFTGAVQAHAGFFEQAEGGTLFLDEVTEMPAALQVYLLRVLETRTLTRVGGSREITVDVRIVAACNRDPQQAMDEGKLRADLYYRLAEFPIGIPALRERREDIPPLAQHFLDRLNRRYGTARSFDAAALRRLSERNWPGNVRELRHAVQRYYILSDSGAISVGPEAAPRAIEENDGSIRFSVGMTFEDIEREMLLKTLASCNNNKRQAARSLGITAKTVYNRLLRYRSQGLIGEDLVGAAPDEREAD